MQVWTNSRVNQVDEAGVGVGDDLSRAATALWVAGVQAASVGRMLGAAIH